MWENTDQRFRSGSFRQHDRADAAFPAKLEGGAHGNSAEFPGAANTPRDAPFGGNQFPPNDPLPASRRGVEAETAQESWGVQKLTTVPCEHF